jgi:GrpE
MTGTDGTGDLARVVRDAMREELEPILPHVLAALKRDQAFDDLSDRLARAERRLAVRGERPLVVAVHRFLNRLRHLDFDPPVKESLAAELVRILKDAGCNETGRAGDSYDPACHEALGGRAVNGEGTVAEVHASGLSCAGDVIVRAKVRVAPREGAPAQACERGQPEPGTESATQGTI